MNEFWIRLIDLILILPIVYGHIRLYRGMGLYTENDTESTHGVPYYVDGKLIKYFYLKEYGKAGKLLETPK